MSVCVCVRVYAFLSLWAWFSAKQRGYGSSTSIMLLRARAWWPVVGDDPGHESSEPLCVSPLLVSARRCVPLCEGGYADGLQCYADGGYHQVYLIFSTDGCGGRHTPPHYMKLDSGCDVFEDIVRR